MYEFEQGRAAQLLMADHGASRRAARDAETARLFALAVSTDDEATRRGLLGDVVVLNLHVAHSIARRFGGRGIPVEDLEQVAAAALFRAAGRFDPVKGRDFLTYAVPSMTGEVKRHFRDLGWMVRPPRRVQSIQSRVVDAYRSGADSGRPPSPARLAEELGLTEPEIREALNARGCFVPQSLDQLAGPGDGALTLGESLPHSDRDAIAVIEARLALAAVLAGLSPEDRHVLHLRFVAERSQEQIAQEMGVGQRHVSRQLARILGDLRARLEGTHFDVA